jgi:hypothetical protein
MRVRLISTIQGSVVSSNYRAPLDPVVVLLYVKGGIHCDAYNACYGEGTGIQGGT